MKEKITLPLASYTYEGGCITEISVGTTGYRGGDWGHGSRVYLRIKNIASTALKVGIDKSQPEDVDEVVLVMGGDHELSALLQMLKFAVARLDNPHQQVEVD